MRTVSATFLMMYAIAAISCSSREQAASTLNASENSAPSLEPDSIPTLDYIPVPFQGRWTGEHHACTDSSSDVDVMYLEPRKVIFWNSFAQVLETTAIDNFQLALKLEYYENQYSVDETREDGRTPQPLDMILRLSADQGLLTTIVDGRSVHVRHRCPSACEVEKAPRMPPNSALQRAGDT
jgi:hypothetical protein